MDTDDATPYEVPHFVSERYAKRQAPPQIINCSLTTASFHLLGGTSTSSLVAGTPRHRTSKNVAKPVSPVSRVLVDVFPAQTLAHSFFFYTTHRKSPRSTGQHCRPLLAAPTDPLAQSHKAFEHPRKLHSVELEPHTHAVSLTVRTTRRYIVIIIINIIDDKLQKRATPKRPSGSCSSST